MKLCGLPKEGEAVFAESLRQMQLSLPSDFKLVTTLRYDPHLKHLTRRIPIAMEDSDEDVFFLSKIHHQRLKYSASILGWDIKISHTEMVAKMAEAVHCSETPLRVRVTVDVKGKIECEVHEISKRDNLFSGLSVTPQKDGDNDPFYEVFVFDKSEVKAEVTNMVKTTDRRLYEGIRTEANVGLHAAREVVTVGTRGELLEGTTTSIAVERNGEWITPRLENGGMVGVTRSFLIELGFVKEGIIFAKDLKNGDKVLLSNGVQGVCAGKLVIPE